MEEVSGDNLDSIDVMSQENANVSEGAPSLVNANCLLDLLEITVSDTEKRLNTGTVNLREAYTVYFIETKVKSDAKWKPETMESYSGIWRRYSEFELLKHYLQTTYPYIIIPPLPEKKITPTDLFHPDFVDRRKAGLEEQVWNDSVAVVGYIGKADAKLKSLSASFMLKKPDKRFEETKNYSNEMYSNISNLLKVRAKLVNSVYGMHKLHANYARVFMQWSPFEKNLSDGLERAAQTMQAYSMLASYLEEEEQYADQMKEYLFFSESLRSVCKQHEMLQYEVERADENLSAKSVQRENVLQGKTSFVSRWFTSIDTDETRDVKLQQLETQLHEAETHCRQMSDESSKFVENALKDLENFQRQKVKDLKETLLLYAILQIKMCKKGSAHWKTMRECFADM